MNENLLEYLENFISENRKKIIGEVINNRTRYITVVLEDIYQSHNASAVLRTCDCFGIQDLHIIENSNKYQINPDVTLGSNKWLTLQTYAEHNNNTLEVIRVLRQQGYRIIATTLGEESKKMEDLVVEDGKIALFFGTEMRGLSDEAIKNADEFVKIPMVGFTQSFNISVSAAIILYYLTSELRKSKIDWQLNEDEKLSLRLQWVKNSIHNPHLIEKEYLNRIANSQKLK